MSGFAAEVTPVVLTRNEEANIGRTLSHLTWAREVVVVDSCSADRTASIAAEFPNVRFIRRPFDDHASQWSFAVEQARTAWVLTLDADYVVPEALAREIDELEPSDATAAYDARFVYAVGGRALRASLYPPRAVLLRRRCATFVMDGHTQRTVVDGGTEHLRTPMTHDDRKPFADFVARQRRYMREEAEKIRGGARDRSSRIRRLRVVAPPAVLLHTLFVKGTALDGVAGFRYAFERFLAEAILSLELLRKKRSR